MRIEQFLKFGIIFLFGFLISSLISFCVVYGVESPFSYGFLNNSAKASAPYDFIKENQIEVFDDRIVVYVTNASLGRYAPTGSMIPILNENSNGIRIRPESESDIHLGDIITFEQNNELIIHRVIEINKDNQGTYYITKGDNNSISDGKIRFQDIRYVTIGILW